MERGQWFCNFNTKVSYAMNHESLADVLKFLLDSNDIDGSLLVLKDVQLLPGRNPKLSPH